MSYRRGDRQPPVPPPDSPLGKDIGESTHRLPGGQPHIRNRPVERQAVPQLPPVPEYSGMMAHGVWTEDVQLSQQAQPGTQTHRANMTVAAPTKRVKPPVIPEQVTPIAVTVVEPPGTSSRLKVAATYRFQVPAKGADPVRIAGRDPSRTRLYILNESPAGTVTSSVSAPVSSVSTSGSADTAAAAQVITSQALAHATTYLITWTVMPGGTVAVASNFGLYADDTLLATSMNTTTAGQAWPQPAITYVSAGTPTLAIENIAADADATYAAQLTTQIQPVTTVTTTAGAGVRIAAFPGDLVSDASQALAVGGAYLPPAMGGYQRIDTQDALWAAATTATPATLSVICEYALERGPA